MRKLLVSLALAIALAGCQAPYAGNPEAYKRAHDRYISDLEPKTGRPDL